MSANAFVWLFTASVHEELCGNHFENLERRWYSGELFSKIPQAGYY